MEQVYWLTNTFIDLIIRDQVLPATINISTIRSAVGGGLEDTVDLVKTHWQDLLLQYVGLLTAALLGLLAALLIPLIGFTVCCCRCVGGRCGAYPDTHYDKKEDSCKRVFLGILLSFFVIAALFGAVSALVCNQYTYNG